MVRALGIFSMAGGFLLISPNLREGLSLGVLQGVGYLNTYSPYSYVGVGITVLGMLTLLARSLGAPR